MGARAGAHTTLRYTPSRHETAQREPCPAKACSLTPHTADSRQHSAVSLSYALAHITQPTRETRNAVRKRSRYYICLHPANQQYTVRLTNNQQVPCLSVRHRSRGIIRHLIAVRRRCPAALRLPEVARGCLRCGLRLPERLPDVRLPFLQSSPAGAMPFSLSCSRSCLIRNRARA